jgi:hypothetical protein
MAEFEQIRRASLRLPGVEEGAHFGGPEFRVGRRTFALWWAKTGRTIMKLDRAHQELLFEARADVFAPCRVGTGVWSFVDIEKLDEAEVDALVVEAWSQVTPKRVSRPVLAARAAGRATSLSASTA